MAEAMEPVEKLVTGAERAMAVAEMVNLLIEAEKALGEGDADRAGEIATRGLEVAVELEDLENIERAKRLLDLVGGAAQEKRNDERDVDEGEDEYKDGQTERGGREEDMSFDDDKIRGASPNAGAEVLGDFLADEFEEEGDWGYEYGNENNEVEAGSDYGSQAQDESNNENDGDNADDLHSNADNEDQDDEDHYNGFDPRNRPQTPVPPRAYDNIEIPRSVTAGKDLIQRYDPWQAYADFKQKELFSSSEVNSSEDNLDEIYCDCDCRNCRKCHYNQESYFSSESEAEAEAEDEDEDEDEDTITATIIRKRRRRDPIVSTNLNYTYTRNLIPKRSVISSKIPRKGAISQYPKPWYRTDENTDLDNDFNALFWHPHTKTLVLQEDEPDWDMNWLPVEEPVSQDNNDSGRKHKASPLDTETQSDDMKNYIPWRTDFWFHFAMPMRDMAPRVRKTDIFPEQAWEFIPKKADWDMFEEAVPEGERFSMQFLEWERERIQRLVREKGELHNRQFKQRQNQEQGWVFVQVDDSAMDWAMWVFVVVVALILLVFWLVL